MSEGLLSREKICNLCRLVDCEDAKSDKDCGYLQDYRKIAQAQRDETTRILLKQWQHAISKSKSKQKAIAARDKWWIEKIDKAFVEDLGGGCFKFKNTISADEWQQIKKEAT